MTDVEGVHRGRVRISLAINTDNISRRSKLRENGESRRNRNTLVKRMRTRTRTTKILPPITLIRTGTTKAMKVAREVEERRNPGHTRDRWGRPMAAAAAR